MKITVKETSVVKPMEETPRGSVWLSNIDILMPATYHSRTVYFFRSNGAADFFDAAVLKLALSRTLVHFYHYAGRLRKDENGRIEINCSGEGVVFIEAECDGTVDDHGFNPRADVSLVPKVDYSQGISSFPLSLMQLTRFRCGGVSLGVTSDHHVADGISGLHYVNTWSEMARGATTITPPLLDRRPLAARNPPQPQFDHIEYHPPPPLKTPLDTTDTSFKTLALTPDQVNAIKQKCNLATDAGGGEKRRYTSYEAIAGHVWRSVCISRGLAPDQETKLQLPVDGRPRLCPPLPPQFFANGIFFTAAVSTCGEMESNPLSFAAGKVKEAVARVDDDYMRSSLDYVEVHEGLAKGDVKCPNFGITSWVRLPFYDADFGWGKPVFAGPGGALFEGKSFLSADPRNEGGLLLSITLLKPHMDLFEKLLYDI